MAWPGGIGFQLAAQGGPERYRGRSRRLGQISSSITWPTSRFCSGDKLGAEFSACVDQGQQLDGTHVIGLALEAIQRAAACG